VFLFSLAWHAGQIQTPTPHSHGVIWATPTFFMFCPFPRGCQIYYPYCHDWNFICHFVDSFNLFPLAFMSLLLMKTQIRTYYEYVNVIFDFNTYVLNFILSMRGIRKHSPIKLPFYYHFTLIILRTHIQYVDFWCVCYKLKKMLSSLKYFWNLPAYTLCLSEILREI